ncbi:hypothetical protein CRM22_002143 [Opisthorchis felineus]|uniref:Uncharacterized protein n=1 Tax=Opisthorchis felineus TaxID=147828 RepID=A0A4S2M7K3_OPIFE|nr:hypothetical protein CRM22_002143 [Opisthorchis felineus]
MRLLQNTSGKTILSPDRVDFRDASEAKIFPNYRLYAHHCTPLAVLSLYYDLERTIKFGHSRETVELMRAERRKAGGVECHNTQTSSTKFPMIFFFNTRTKVCPTDCISVST